MWLNLVSYKTGDPCLKSRSVSQPQISFSNVVFTRYAWLIRCYNALKFITFVWSVQEIFTLTLLLDEAFFLDVSIFGTIFRHVALLVIEISCQDQSS